MSVTNKCSRCAGHGLVTGYGGDPTDCRSCGGAGVVWPPYCTECGSFARLGEPCKRCERRAAKAAA